MTHSGRHDIDFEAVGASQGNGLSRLSRVAEPYIRIITRQISGTSKAKPEGGFLPY